MAQSTRIESPMPLSGGSGGSAIPLPAVAARPDYSRQAYRILQTAFVLMPIVVGVDKFFDDLVNWEMYLAPSIPTHLHIAAGTLMKAAGVMEISVGIIVATWPRVGAYIVTAWLWSVIVNLLLIPGFYDVALRDFGLSLGALALARLSEQFNVRT